MIFFYYILTGIITFLISLVSVFFIIFDFWLMFIPQYKRYYTADRFLVIPWTVVANFLLGIRLKLIGKENIDKKRTTLYICNHQS
ncbi:MAG TPA: hypothetical protein PLO89_09335, partial [Spirochaetota bacterium]|nr:hypothetical protein [Spirochaetota bacterium]